MIEKGIIQEEEEFSELVDLASKILDHFCNHRILCRISGGDNPGVLICRKQKNDTNPP